MANQQMIESWQRGQAQYTQARHFTPGRQRTQYRTTEHGQASEMDLLVVVHNDAPAADIGLQRVDLVVNSGRYDRAAMHANGHLVNNYDEQAGITDHTALYRDQDMVGIRQGGGPPISVWGRGGDGPPGAEVYSVWARLKTNARGDLVIDTARPIHPGSGADCYSLHDAQVGMVRAALREAGADPAYGQGLASPLYSAPAHATPPQVAPGQVAPGQVAPGQVAPGRAAAYTPEQLAAIRETSGRPTPTAPGYRMNSQAGLAAASGPRRPVPSSPAPGQPGSRFNPNIRERQPQPQTPAAPGMVTAIDVPRNPSTNTEQKAAQKAARQARREEEADLDRKMAPRHAAKAGAKVGAKAGPVVPGIGAAARAAIGGDSGAGGGVIGSSARGAEAMRHAAASTARAEQPKVSPSAGQDFITGMGSVLSRGPEQNTTPQRTRRPVSERYDYQFEGNDQTSGIEQQHGD